MPVQDVHMRDSMVVEKCDFPSRLRRAFAILMGSSVPERQREAQDVSPFEVFSAFIDPRVKPLAIYQAASCLRENELREIVQVMVFSGPTSLLPALRLLNIMRGLPGTWELAMDLLEQNNEVQIYDISGIRAMTLLALLGGKKAYDLCDWSAVIRDALEKLHEEASLALHMIMEKKWTGSIETVYKIYDWQGQEIYSQNPSFWREMQWASYSRELCSKVAFCEQPFISESMHSSRTRLGFQQGFEQLPSRFGTASSHYVRAGGVLFRRRLGDVGTSANDQMETSCPSEEEQGDLTDLSSNGDFVYTSKLRHALKSLAGALSFGVPVIVEGNAGCGKTSLISLLGRETTYKKPALTSKVPAVTFIQMDSALNDSNADSFDSFIGVVVPLPEGKGFQWRAGPIGLAIEKGGWLVLENMGQLSTSSSSVVPLIATLAQLQAGDTMKAPGRERPLTVGKGFRCVATRTTLNEEGKGNWNPPGGWEVWERVTVPSLSVDEQMEMLQMKFPFIKDCVPRVLKCVVTVSDWCRNSRTSFCRDITLREAVLICKRLASLRREQGDLMTAESALLETIDVLVSWCVEGEGLDMLLNALSANWSLPPSVARDLVSHHRPLVSTGRDLFRVGRSSLSLKDGESSATAKKLTMTSYTLRLMERVLRCLQMGENVLLTGEAGSGKTAIIQEAAAFLQTELVVVNLSRQSELGDLMGTFRPVEMTAVIPLLAKKFEEAFCFTMSRRRNGKFLDALRKASCSSEYHETAVRLMKRAAEAIPKSAKSTNKFLAQKWRTIMDELDVVGRTYLPSHTRNDIDLEDKNSSGRNISERPRKRRKEGHDLYEKDRETPRDNHHKNRRRMKRRVDFHFSEGVFAKAMRLGEWILLDEINLAPPELLERIVSVLDRGEVLLPDGEGSVLEKADGFRLFAAMNPPTDVGKRPLPNVLRARFTEFHCGDMLDKDDVTLLALHRFYGLRDFLSEKGSQMSRERSVAEDIASFYLQSCSLARDGRLEEVSGRSVRFSLRTLSRMLDFASGLRRYMRSGDAGVRRALYEGALLSFATPLPKSSRLLLSSVAKTCLLRVSSNRSRLDPLSGVVSLPPHMERRVRYVEGVPLEINSSGRQFPCSPDIEERFIISPTVRETLRDVCRALVLGTQRLPVVLQGPTAAGKTSLVTYLASVTGNSLVRINNHEHTDLSEYLGGYVATPNGTLNFHEGPLVRAAKAGSWVLLDELNLAPPEILESLNRLLDDNREILLPETGEVVKAESGFTVFATQNPPGLYGGRKELSRAFRSRFIEIQVSDLTDEDLLTILQKRCCIPSSFAKKMVAVMRELQLRRRTTSIFSGRDGFVTARDLFRWASRGPRSKEELAVHGFFLLAERSRRNSERSLVREILVKVIGISSEVLGDDALYSIKGSKAGISPSQECLEFSLEKLSLKLENIRGAMQEEGLVSTPHAWRMLTLMIHCVANSEPVLLVGSTGGGKTSCCSVISRALRLRFETVNCHQHTEASDVIGSYRPSRSMGSSDALFEWVDGPLVRAMREGSILLIDEINMADDAVVERFNSVLELERRLLLSEKGAVASGKRGAEATFISEELTAHSKFRVLATMNPGGDYGKKELSPALRNRLTEIWVPAPATLDNFSPIITATLCPDERYLQNDRMQLSRKALCAFLEWLLSEHSNSDLTDPQNVISPGGIGKRLTLSVRDVSTWCDFISEAYRNMALDPLLGLVHGARLVFLDGLAVGSTGSNDSNLEIIVWEKLISLLPRELHHAASSAKFESADRHSLETEEEQTPTWNKDLTLFKIPKNSRIESSQQTLEGLGFSFGAPCTARNTARIARAMAVSKRPILLEGPPGCGKSSLVAALAKASNFSFIRINLSDSTEMSDLIGSDSPGQVPGVFTFRAGPLLKAIQEGSWVLLDELNLASQSVLEGLNSVLDHRRTIFVPELSQEIMSHPEFRVFGAQNPAYDGGGRRGLPQSFLNRFARVQIAAPKMRDVLSILTAIHPLIDRSTTSSIVKALSGVREGLESSGYHTDSSAFGLRDALRLCDLYCKLRRKFGPTKDMVFPDSTSKYCLGISFDIVVAQGLQRGPPRELSREVFRKTFGFRWDLYPGQPALLSSGQGVLKLGESILQRTESFPFEHLEPCGLLLCHGNLPELQALNAAVNTGWPVVLSSSDSFGSPTDGIRLVQTLASLCGRTVKVVHGGSLSDCDEFMGGYCQHDVVDMMQKMQVQVDCLFFRVLSRFMAEGSKSSSRTSFAISTAIRHHLKVLKGILEQVSGMPHKIAEDDITRFQEISEKLIFEFTSVINLEEDFGFRLRAIHSILQELRKLQRAAAEDRLGSFEWRKSDFLRAIEAGEWIVVRDADFCAPAILDRLNPVLERPAVAVIDSNDQEKAFCASSVLLAEAPANEDGSPIYLEPHPDFRIFFISSTQGTALAGKGLSRALLDRSLKISLSSDSDLELERDSSSYSMDEENSYHVAKVFSSGVDLGMMRYRAALEGTNQCDSRPDKKQHRDLSDGMQIGRFGMPPRTHVSNLSLEPMHALIQRGLSALHKIENMTTSELVAICDPLVLFPEGKEYRLLASSGIVLSVHDSTLRTWLLLLAAQGFILASQSHEDVCARYHALTKSAEQSTVVGFRKSYYEVAGVAKNFCSTYRFSQLDQPDRSLTGEPLPIDPLYSFTTPSTLVSPLLQKPESFSVFATAVRFRMSVIAVQAYQNSWQSACSKSDSEMPETIFGRARLWCAVKATVSSTTQSTRAIDVMCYEVLSSLSKVPKKLDDFLALKKEWMIPEEERIFVMFVSARELCDKMVDPDFSNTSELYAHLLDIITMADAIHSNPASESYGLRTICMMKTWKEITALQFIPHHNFLLMPKTQAGLEAEAEMLKAFPFHKRVAMGFTAVNAFVQGLVSLSAGNVERDENVIAVLQKVSAALTNRDVGNYGDLDRSRELQYWADVSTLSAVNSLRRAMLMFYEITLRSASPHTSTTLQDSIAQAIFCFETTPNSCLESAISLQRLQWLISKSSDNNTPSFAWTDIGMPVMSGLLAESANLLSTGMLLDSPECDNICGNSGMCQKLFHFVSKSARHPLSSLFDARCDAVSALTSIISGSHRLIENNKVMATLLLSSLRSCLKHSGFFSRQDIDLIVSSSCKENIELLSQKTSEHLDKCSQPSDTMELCSLSARVLLAAKALFDERDPFVHDDVHERPERIGLDLSNIGTTWTAIGLLRMKAFKLRMKDSNGIDPSQLARALVELNEQRRLRARLGIYAYSLLRNHCLGGDLPSKCVPVCRLETQYNEAGKMSKESERHFVYRPRDRASFSALLATLDTIDVGITDKILHNVPGDGMFSTCVNEDRDADAVEEALHAYQSCNSSAKDIGITGRFSHFRDLTSELALGLREVQYGQMCSARGGKLQSLFRDGMANKKIRTYCDISRFPRAAYRTAMSISEALRHYAQSGLHLATLTTCAEYLICSELRTVSRSSIELSDAMDFIVGLWKTSSVQDDEERAAKASLHVLKEAGSQSNIQWSNFAENLDFDEEQDFNDTFNPLGEEEEVELLGLSDSFVQVSGKDVSVNNKQSNAKGTLEYESIWKMHQRIFPRVQCYSRDRSQLLSRRAALQSLLKHLYEMSGEIHLFVEHVPGIWPVFSAFEAMQLVNESVPDDTTRELIPTGQSEVMEKSNFYRNPNLLELRYGLKAIHALRERIHRIQKTVFKESGGHPVLQEIVAAIDRVVERCNLTTPLSKVVIGVENVLRKVDEWQRLFATAATKLEMEVQGLSRVAVRWRRLEKNSWNLLIQSRCEAMERRASVWFFYLYDALIREASSMDQSLVEEACKNITATLDQFMRSAPSGEFSCRLEMLTSISTHMLFLGKNGNNLLAVVGLCVRGIARYYSHSAAAVSEELKSAKQLVETKLAEFSKLLSWEPRLGLGASQKMARVPEKHLEYYRLKEEAQRTKRKLHKLCMEMDSALRIPAYAHLTKEIQKIGFQNLQTEEDEDRVSRSKRDIHTMCTEQMISNSVEGLVKDISELSEGEDIVLGKNVSSSFSSLGGKPILVKIPLFKTRLNQFGALMKNSQSSCCDSGTVFCRDARVNIRSRSLRLKHSKDPNLQLKKRALTDLLQALRNEGLSQFEKGKTQSGFKPLQWLSSPDPSENPNFKEISNELFYGNAQQLRRLREVSDSRMRNPDITLDEALKSRAMCEHLFDMTCLQRESLNRVVQDAHSFVAISSYFEAIEKDIDHSKEYEWNDDATLNVQQVINKLMNITDDLKVVFLSVTSAMQASREQKKARKENGSVPLFDDSTRSLRQISTIFEKTIKLLDDLLGTNEIKQLEKRSAEGGKLFIPDSIFAEIFRDMINLRDNFDVELRRARGISDQNIAVQVFAPVSTFLHSSVQLIQRKLQIQSLKPTLHSTKMKQKIVALHTSVVERILVGSQNILTWAKVHLHHEAGSEIGTQGSLNSGEVSAALKQGILVCAHTDILSYRRLAKLQELGETLNQAVGMHRDFARCMTINDDPHFLNSYVALCRSIGGLIDAYINSIVLPSVSKMAAMHCSSLALLKTISSVFVGICMDGFCRPMETNVESAKDEGTIENAGTGFGNAEDGDMSGAKDISEDIEEEGQLIGLQSDNPDDAEREPDNADQDVGFDMKTDFDGNVEDFEPKEDKRADPEADEPEKDISGEGESGKDVIDEKLWEGEGDPLESSRKEEGQADATKGTERSELMPKSEEKSPEEQERNSRPPQDDFSAQEEKNEAPDDDEPVPQEESGAHNGQEPQENETISKLEVEDQENSNRAAKQEGPEDRAHDEADKESRDENGMNSMAEGEIQSSPEDKSEEASPDDNCEEMIGFEENAQEPRTDPLGEDHNEEIETSENDGLAINEGDCEMEDLSLDEGNESLPDNMDDGTDIDHSASRIGEQLRKSEQEPDPLEENIDCSGSGDEKGPAANEAGHDSALTGTGSSLLQRESQMPVSPKFKQSDKKPPIPDSNSEYPFSNDQQLNHGGSQEHKMGKRSNMQVEQEPTMRSKEEDSEGLSRQDEVKSSRNPDFPDTNPLRATVNDDLISSWNKYLEVSDNNRKDTFSENADTTPNTGAFEFQEDEIQSAGMVALGAATKEQQQPLPDMAPTDDVEDVHINENSKVVDSSQSLPPSPCDDSKPPQQSIANADATDLQKISQRQHEAEEKKSLEPERNEPSTHPARVAAETSVPASPRSRGGQRSKCQKDNKMGKDLEENHREDQDSDADQIELSKTATWKPNIEELSAEEATLLWRKLIQATASGASSLCEMLRLVLEPTIASKLGGGYRTGKRLNMRKVIEFVASDFRKDRIWLRRVRPNKRSYDVLLAIDDSESMSESRAGPMALESLALVASALAKLEIGRLAVARFGGAPHMVKPFDEPILMSDVRGGQLLKEFSFAQKDTNICELLQFMQDALVGVEESESAEQVKLAFVISDGRLSAREEIKRRLRNLREANVLVAFLIIDKSGINDTSIYDVRRVEYTSGGKIEVLPYMQDFPIEFYTVVQDVHLLPTILADALKQWVETTSTDH